MTSQNRRLLIILLIASLLLAIPFIAMQFTDDVKWTATDFIVAGALLYGTGLLCAWGLRRFKRPGSRVLLITSLLVVLVLVWAEIAVGLFGTMFAGH